MLFWNGTPIDPEKSPVKASDALFGGQTTDAARQRRRAAAQGSARVHGVRGPGPADDARRPDREQTKLATHLAAIQSLQSDARRDAAVGVHRPSPRLPTVEMVRAQSAGNVPSIRAAATTTSMRRRTSRCCSQAQLELVTQAMICNAAPIIGLMPMYATCDFDFSFANAPGSHHNGLSHSSRRSRRRRARSTTRPHRREPAGGGAHAVRDRAEVVHAPSW